MWPNLQGPFKVGEEHVRQLYVATLSRGEFVPTERLLSTLDQVRVGQLTGNDFVLFVASIGRGVSLGKTDRSLSTGPCSGA